MNDSKASIECSNDINDYYNIEKYNPDKKHKILIVFDDIIADILSNKKPNPIVSELFIKGKKQTFLCTYHPILFCCTKKIRLNSAHYFIMKIPNEEKLQQISLNHLSNIDFREFMHLYSQICTVWTVKLNYFLVIDATHTSDNSLKKNIKSNYEN